MTSVLRDTRVEVPNDYGMKITSTYHKGGVPLLREVFELNFNIPVDNYILVNYLNVVDIIDALGGGGHRADGGRDKGDVREDSEHRKACGRRAGFERDKRGRGWTAASQRGADGGVYAHTPVEQRGRPRQDGARAEGRGAGVRQGQGA